MRKKRVLDNLIIMLVLGLLIFHTFTFFQSIYNYYTTLIVFVLVLLLSLIKNKGYMKVSRYNGVIFLSLMTVILIIMGAFFKEKGLVYMVGAYLPYVIWPILYAITEPLLEQKGKREFLLVFALSLVISVVATLSVLITDNDAARLLAGWASDSVRQGYYNQGVGGYGFVYGCVFLMFGLTIWSAKEQNSTVKVLLWTIVLLMLIMIMFSSYTIAVLFMLVVMVLSAYSRSKRKEATTLLVIFVLMTFLLMSPILIAIHDLAERLGLEWIVKRTTQLINAQKAGNLSELSRIKLYQVSLSVFKENILFGGTQTGGHSMVLDHLAEYGILGVAFCFSFFRCLNKLGKDKDKRIRLIYWLVIGLLCINTADTIVMFPMVLFALPLMLSYKGKDEVENEGWHFNTLLSKQKLRR